jgi:DNA-binding SARP family transcriptional activator
MEFKLLGPLAIEVGGRQIEPGGTRQRGLLAILLLPRGEVVSAERLIEELYGTQPPASAATSLRAHVSRLRRALGGSELLRTRAGGYVLEVEKDSIDAQVFERLLEQGRSQRASGNAAQAAATLRQALELWRGPPLADFAYADFAQSEIARLDELRLAAIEERIEAELDLGHHAELVGELERLVRDYPLRERLRGHLMLALYRSGRQAEALASFQDARRILVDQLGIEPGSDLRALQQAILRHEVDLDLARTRPARPPRFPPALGALPVGLTRLVGRAQDIEEICELMRGDVRILTLTGPGGIGKTRVAIEAAASVAREFDDGARFVPLAPL